MPSGMEALIDSIKSHIFIADLYIPEIDGFELLKILRPNPNFNSTLILALSVLSTEEINFRSLLPKDWICLSKPIKIDWFHGFFSGILVRNSAPLQNL